MLPLCNGNDSIMLPGEWAELTDYDFAITAKVPASKPLDIAVRVH